MLIHTESVAPATSGTYRTGYVWTVCLVAALGGLLFGYDWVVIGGAKPFYEKYFDLNTPSVSGWANSCALVGCLIGALVSGALSDGFGRKKLLIVSALIFLVSSLGTGLAHTFNVFVAWRIMGGVAIGMASNLSPMYVSEMAPAQIRGQLVAVNQLTIVIGILAAQVINWLIARGLPSGASNAEILSSWYGQVGWRWMFAITAVPSLLFFVGMFFVPESPRWLMRKGRRQEAESVLARVGGQAHAGTELAEIEATLQRGDEHVNLGALFEPRMLKILGLGVMLAVLQQWCGINVIFTYAENIFRDAGYDISNVLSNIAWTGSVNLAFTFVALGVVDRGGRRPLMLFGSAGLAIIYAIMAFCFHRHVTGMPVLLLVLAAIACYACSLAPIVWVVIAEIFPNRIRGAAMAVSVSALWIGCFLLTYTFPLLNAKLGAAMTFATYGGICVFIFGFVWICLPETKGKSLEQIEAELLGAKKAFPVVTAKSS